MQPFYEKKEKQFHCFPSRNMTFPAHLHNAAELIFIRDGAIEITIQDQKKTVRKNEIALVFPDMIHSYYTQDSSSSILCIFSPSRAREYYHVLCRQQLQDPFFSAASRDMDLAFAFEKMLQFADRCASISEAWLNLILTYLMSEAVLVPRSKQDLTDISYQLISYVSVHFHEPLTLDKIAQELHFNKYYISRIFSDRLHCSFPEYINRLRLDYAARRLRTSDSSITEIWQDAGFISQKTFNRRFLSCYGMTPSQYRRTIP